MEDVIDSFQIQRAEMTFLQYFDQYTVPRLERGGDTDF